MKVLVIGSGGREHSMCWAIARSPRLTALYALPGNGGMEEIATCLAGAATDTDRVIEVCREKTIDFVVVGPEQPLVAGLVDDLAEAGFKAFGPTAKAAILEGSKSFTKEFCKRHSIPTAAFERFTDLVPAQAYIRARGAPIVVKADGLAAGKGAIVCMTLENALGAAAEILGGAFGAAGDEIVIEEFMAGEEASFFVLCDGETLLPLATAQDHKRVGEGDTGPNTGGMGAYSPAPVMSEELIAQTMARIIEPTLAGMAAEGRPFKGVLYAGLMITADGPRLIEYNVRFGDPECQAILPRLKSDFLTALLASAEGGLAGVETDWRPEPAVAVVMAADGYPGAYDKGSEIGDLAAAAALAEVTIFHAGTRREGDRVLASGGRVLNVVALGADVRAAQARAYQAVDAIDWPQGFCRRDIAWRAIRRLDQS